MPTPEDVLRLMVWFILALAYIGFWLALALLCSVVLVERQTSALVALAVWLVLTAFFSLMIGVVAGILAPVPPDAAAGGPESLRNAQHPGEPARLAPNQLFREAAAIMLDPPRGPRRPIS